MKFEGKNKECDFRHSSKLKVIVAIISTFNVFTAASCNQEDTLFKVGSVTPKHKKRKNGTTHKVIVEKRKKDYKRCTNVEEGRRRRTSNCKEFSRARKEKNVTIRRSLRNPNDKKSDGTKGRSSTKEKLTLFYKTYNPNKLDEVDELLEKYDGREEEMFRRLLSKYRADPSVFGLDGMTTSKVNTFIPQSEKSETTFGFTVANASSKPDTFQSTVPVRGFGTSNNVFKSSYSSFAEASASFSASQTVKNGSSFLSFGSLAAPSFTSLATPSFNSLAATKTSVGNGFGSFSSSKPATFGGVWGRTSNIRTNRSFDSEAMEGMDCD